MIPCRFSVLFLFNILFYYSYFLFLFFMILFCIISTTISAENTLYNLLSFDISCSQRGDSGSSQAQVVILSPKADLTVCLIKYGGIALLVLVILGTIFDFTKYMRGLF